MISRGLGRSLRQVPAYSLKGRSEGVQYGPELITDPTLTDVNQWFLNNTGVSASDGQIHFATAHREMARVDGLTLVAGAQYLVTLEISSFTSNAGVVEIGIGELGNLWPEANGVGTFEKVCTAKAPLDAGHYIRLRPANSGGATLSVSYFSVRRLLS